MFVHKEDGHAVHLIEQDETGRVAYNRDGGKTQHMAGSEFFAKFREATREEIEAPREIVKASEKEPEPEKVPDHTPKPEPEKKAEEKSPQK